MSAAVPAGGDRPARAIDLDEVLAELPGGMDMARELAAIFLDEYAASSDRLRRGLADGDLRSVRREAHTLKSSAAIFAAHEMADAAERLESLAAAGDAEKLTEALGDLEREAARVMGELKELRAADG